MTETEAAVVATPTFRAIASLLDEIDPDALVRLRDRFPAQKAMFDSAFWLGKERAPDVEEDALRSFAETGLQASERKLEQLVAALAARMRLARKVKLGGAVVASVSSVGVISALALAQREAALATALVGLVSSVATLLGEHLDQPLVGNHKSLREYLAEALSAESKARKLRIEFAAGKVTTRKGLFELAGKVNEIAATVRSIMVFGGVSVAEGSGR